MTPVHIVALCSANGRAIHPTVFNVGAVVWLTHIIFIVKRAALTPSFCLEVLLPPPEEYLDIPSELVDKGNVLR